MNGGGDTFSASGNLSPLTSLSVDGGAGNDTILGGNGGDILIGGAGNDFVDGNQGADSALLGAGDDVFNWDPGDGSDVVEGQAGTDTLRFNGSAANETFDVSANGGRVLLQRNVGAIVMDLNDVEHITINTGAGTDTVNVHDLSGTDVDQVTVNHAGTIGGVTPDGAADNVIVNGTNGDDVVTVSGDASGIHVTGLGAEIVITNFDAGDTLQISGLGGDDVVDASGLAAGLINLVIDGGDGNNILLGSAGADTIFGGAGDDVLIGNAGTDTLDGGSGNNILIQ